MLGRVHESCKQTSDMHWVSFLFEESFEIANPSQLNNIEQDSKAFVYRFDISSSELILLGS